MALARRATFAGSWYSSDSGQLAEDLAGWLSEAQATCGAARAIIAPHAGYSYSGETAAWAYKHVDRSGIRRVFLLGPSHHVYLTRCTLTTCSEYSTPLGPVPVDKQASDALRQTGLFDDMARKTWVRVRVRARTRVRAVGVRARARAWARARARARARGRARLRLRLRVSQP